MDYLPGVSNKQTFFVNITRCTDRVIPGAAPTTAALLLFKEFMMELFPTFGYPNHK